jgi:hypothetical protein
MISCLDCKNYLGCTKKPLRCQLESCAEWEDDRITINEPDDFTVFPGGGFSMQGFMGGFGGGESGGGGAGRSF